VNLGPDPALLERLRDRLGGLVIVNADAEPAAYHALPPSIRSGLPLILVNFRPPVPPLAAVEVLLPQLRQEPGLAGAGPADPRGDPFRGDARAPVARTQLGDDVVRAALGGEARPEGGAAEVRLSYAPAWKAADGSPVLQTDLNHMLVFLETGVVDLAYRAPLSRLVTLAMLLLAIGAAAAAAAGVLPRRARARGDSPCSL
jgi:hypothetical protein